MSKDSSYRSDSSYILAALLDEFEIHKFILDKRIACTYDDSIYKRALDWFSEYKEWLKNDYEFVNEKQKERFEIHLKKRESL